MSLEHPLVKLAGAIDWQRFEEAFGVTFDEETGRPAISTRLMVALHYLKYAFDLSDEQVVARWIENPYWQYLSGMKFFQHVLPIDPSSMTRWRKRIGEAGAEELLKETIHTGLRTDAVKRWQLKRVNADTTVQEKDVRHPTDARLYQRARERLVAQARREGIELRQSYVRVGKQTFFQHARYARAQQFRRARRQANKLRTFLGRVVRDIERKATSPSEELQDLLKKGHKLYQQQRKDKNKLYSVHAPEVECIAKGKAHKRYEFGCKASLAATSKGGWMVAAHARHGNPYDGHTLDATISQIERVTGRTPEHAFVDMGYRKHDYAGPCQVHVDKRRRGKIPRSLWRWMKRRAAIEPSIGHLKSGKRMGRNRLKGVLGDQLNVVLAAAGLNFAKLLATLRDNPTLLARLLLHLANRLQPPQVPDKPLAAAA